MSASPLSPLSQPEAWNLVSPGYAELLLPEFTKYASDVLRRVSLKATDHVLDVATGPGTLALLAAPKVAQGDGPRLRGTDGAVGEKTRC